MNWFRRRAANVPAVRHAAVAPHILRLATPPAAVYAVGDVHGQLALYEALEAQIVADGAAIAGVKLIVMLGDLIDRGPDSAGVVARMLAPAPQGFQRLVLSGNHEWMFLQFLRDPARHLEWLTCGGLETLRSYGIAIVPDEDPAADIALLKHRLALSVPQAHRQFLATLAFGLEMGRYRFAHAGYDTGRTAAAQDPQTLLWGPRPVGAEQALTLVHGHVPVPEVQQTSQTIALDLGSYRTGRLAALRILSDDANASPSVSSHKVLLVDSAPPHFT
ncbi:metallophosphoesterase [Thalassobius sp. Cn5-15]|uniref:metallophosphoesterase n=1 Tax=Thalassobius sp. Cn5-15 TaxID=2917763 RepID=UPI001EF1AEBE|nr:metallophosphoesterase [Thalassobius sp. Cn5-15]MCG7494020.1 metallophosphoesterase [Thalassobius sp. Cn5-15]